MPVTEVKLPAWQFNGSVDDMPGWLKDPGHVVSVASVPEVLSTGRQVAAGEKVLRLRTGGALAVGDYAVRGIVGHEPVAVRKADLEQRHGVR